MASSVQGLAIRVGNDHNISMMKLVVLPQDGAGGSINTWAAETNSVAPQIAYLILALAHRKSKLHRTRNSMRRTRLNWKPVRLKRSL